MNYFLKQGLNKVVLEGDLTFVLPYLGKLSFDLGTML